MNKKEQFQIRNSEVYKRYNLKVTSAIHKMCLDGDFKNMDSVGDGPLC